MVNIGYHFDEQHMPRMVQDLDLAPHGARLYPAALTPLELEHLAGIVAGLPRDEAGLRIHGIPELRQLLGPRSSIGTIAAALLGPLCRPVRAILFDKTPQTNWALGWHQDRTIAVRARIDVEGYGPWTKKQGMIHVEPPFEMLAAMITLRIHLDPVSTSNAPLWIAPGSHRLGRIPVEEIPNVVNQCGSIACLAAVGDIWVYSTPILHASEAAVGPIHRRVLQVDYSSDTLPGGLEWLGV